MSTAVSSKSTHPVIERQNNLLASNCVILKKYLIVRFVVRI